MATVEKTRAKPVAKAQEDQSEQGVGHEIRAMRRARGMTLSDVATAANLSVGFMSLVERGQKQPSLDALQRISRALGVEVGWLFPSSPNDDPVENAYVVRKGFRGIANLLTRRCPFRGLA